MKRFRMHHDKSLDDMIAEQPHKSARSTRNNARKPTSQRLQGISKRTTREREHQSNTKSRFGISTSIQAESTHTQRIEVRDSKQLSPPLEMENLKIQIVNTSAKPKQKTPERSTRVRVESSFKEERPNTPQSKNASSPLTAETATQLVQDVLLKTLPQIISSMAHLPPSQSPHQQAPHQQPQTNVSQPVTHTQIRGQQASQVPSTSTSIVDFTSRSINDIFASISKNTTSNT